MPAVFRVTVAVVVALLMWPAGAEARLNPHKARKAIAAYVERDGLRWEFGGFDNFGQPLRRSCFYHRHAADCFITQYDVEWGGQSGTLCWIATARLSNGRVRVSGSLDPA